MKKLYLWFIALLVVGTTVGFFVKFTFFRPAFIEKELFEQYKTFTLNLDWPVFNQKTIDNDLNAFIHENVIKISQAPPRSPNDPRHYKNDLFLSYEKPVISKHYISLAFYVSTYTGGAHPNTIVVCKTYDRSTGKLLHLADFYSKAPDRLRGVLVDKLVKTLEYFDPVWVKDGVKANNLENFVVDRNGLTFYFSPYEVTAYAYGVQKVKVSLAELAKL